MTNVRPIRNGLSVRIAAVVAEGLGVVCSLDVDDVLAHALALVPIARPSTIARRTFPRNHPHLTTRTLVSKVGHASAAHTLMSMTARTEASGCLARGALAIWIGLLALLVLCAVLLTVVSLGWSGRTPPTAEVPPPTGYVSAGDRFCPGSRDGCAWTLQWFNPSDSSSEQLSAGQIADHLRSLGWVERSGRFHRPPDRLGQVIAVLGVPSPYEGQTVDPFPNDRVLVRLTYADGGRSRARTFVAIVWVVTAVPLLATMALLIRRWRRSLRRAAS
jgi:hypothetical protein